MGRLVVRGFEFKRVNCDLIMCEIGKCGKFEKVKSVTVHWVHVLGLRRAVEDSRGKFGSLKPRVNFTIILQAAFTPGDPKSAKKDSQVKQLFALWGSASIKAVRKHVDVIDPYSNLT